jgi:aspartate kinase
MQVYKFGGASTQSIERIQQVAHIIKQKPQEPLLVVISAMGKTTNALEKVAAAFYNNHLQQALDLFNTVKQQHLTTAKYLLVKQYNACLQQLQNFFTEVEWLLHDKPVRDYDYYYDQIVCIGEMMSSTIVSFYLMEEKIDNTWLDVRDYIRTDDNFRNAGIDWAKTIDNIDGLAIEPHSIFITQGFVGATDENESTTLGREGSDYTAAIFANIFNAAAVSIWKDVEGVMNADPKQFNDAVIIPELSFNEVIEMAFYGAQVIHPKTIKPLENKGIPLKVKCFLDSSLPGTIIYKKQPKQLPPIMVVKNKQVLLQLTNTDFSFVADSAVIALYQAFKQYKLQPNVMQTGAISIQVVVDDNDEKINAFAAAMANTFDIQIQRNLSILTVRHYTSEVLTTMLHGKQIILQQHNAITHQTVYEGEIEN